MHDAKDELYDALAQLPPDRRKQKVLQLCRTYSAAMCAYVLEDEATGKPITMANVHKEWHDIVNAEQRVIFWGSVECGKSVQISVGYTAWRIGQNPRLRVVVLSNTQKPQAQKIVAALQKVITSPRYREVFPHIQPDSTWNSSALTVKGWDGRNPTVQAIGLHGNVLGSRVDLLIIDDPLDYENTRTEELRDDAYNWYYQTLTGRLTRDAQVVMVANAWHPRDMLHRLQEDRNIWFTKRYPIWQPCDDSDPDGVFVPDKGCKMKPIWAGQWPIERIMAKREELAGHVDAFARQYECIAKDDANEIFKEDWILQGLKNGAGLPWARSVDEATGQDGNGESFVQVIIGVDLATKRPAGRAKKSTGETVFTMIGVRATNGRRRLLSIEAGRFHGPDIIRRMLSLNNRFTTNNKKPQFWVETNGAQQYIVDFADDPVVVQALGGGFGAELDVYSFDTNWHNKNDANFGIEGLGAELHIGQWELPCPCILEHAHGAKGGSPCKIPQGELKLVRPHLERQLNFLLEGMVTYSPVEHSADHLMSMWIGKEGVRIGMGEVKSLPSNSMRR